MRISSSLNNLTFLVWNVGGFTKDKWDDSKFRNLLKYDVICLTETHTTKTSKINIPGYIHSQSTRETESNNSRKKSGGIAVYVKSSIASGTEFINSEHDDILWLKFKKNQFDIQKDIYFGAVYITPSNSSSTKSRYSVDPYMILQKEVSFFSSLNGEIILGGDFNSRLGNKHKDYIITDTNEFLPIDNSIIETDILTFRNSQDKKTNSNGKHLADLCMINNLKILNGRKIGDLTGKYTCHQYNGSSVVDYIIAEPNIFDKINYFQVLPLTSYSDHCQIIANLDIKPINPTNTSGKRYAKAPRQFKWDSNSKQKVNSYLRSHDFTKAIKILKQNLGSPTSDIHMNTTATDLTNILINVSKNCLKLNKTQKRKTKNNKNREYFDYECYLKRKELQRLGRLLSNHPNNINIRNTYFQTKKQYKNMIKSKKRNFKEEKLNLLANLGNNDIKQKWKIIKSITDGDRNKEDPAREIDLERWKTYFHKLYNSNQTNDSLPKSFSNRGRQNRIDRTDFETMKEILNCPFTKKEILSCKDKLKNSKASGIDMIKNEVLKICLDDKGFLEVLHLLVNKIFNEGKYPTAWKTELVRPIHKKEETYLEKNYRGISLTSCLGKFFNNLLLMRLSKCFEDLRLFQDHMMGFRPNMRTSNNIFVLKTLIDKQFQKNEKLYCCFVDFSKAFDTVWRKGLVAKLKTFGICGKMLNIIENLYLNTNGHVTVGDFISDNFEINLGVKQGDPPSPFFFNVYMDELCSDLIQMEQDAPTINGIKIPCLFWADDLVLISTTKDGLQNQLNVVNDYCSNWKLTLNAEKTKTVIFNKAGATLKKHQIHYGGELIKTVKYFSYLGITLDSNGKFHTAINELTKKAAKAAGRLYKLSTYNYISIQTLLETFNSLVKPILLFSSEIWGHESKEESGEVEKLFSKFCKHLLGVHKNTTNLAIHGELATYPLHIDIRIKMMLYFLYLRDQNNKILSGTITELQNMNNGRGSTWIRKIEKLITDNNLDIASYKYSVKNEKLHELFSHNKLRIILREKLQTSFIEEWDTKTANMSKLSFYRQYKQSHRLENYVVLVNNRRHRSALTKLRCSAHRLKIEIGRYSRIYNDDAKRYEQLPREKRTCDTCKDKVEDELHFLLECPLNEEIRHNFLQKIDKIVTEDFRSWSDTDRIKYLFETTDKPIINCFGKFVFDSFEKHRKHLGSGVGV